jgi:hypothetical protein
VFLDNSVFSLEKRHVPEYPYSNKKILHFFVGEFTLSEFSGGTQVFVHKKPFDSNYSVADIKKRVKYYRNVEWYCNGDNPYESFANMVFFGKASNPVSWKSTATIQLMSTTMGYLFGGPIGGVAGYAISKYFS